MRNSVKTVSGAFIPALAAFVGSTVPAMAHPGHGDGGFVSGLVHPLTGVDHLAAMVAVGLWAATRPARQAWMAPAAFMAALAAGAGAGVAFGAVPGVESMVAVSVLVLGALLVLATRLSSGVALALIAGAGVLHGMAHGAEATGSLPAYFAGFLGASAMLHAGGWQAGRTIFARGQGRVVAGLALGITGLALLAS